jgi:hypothetical protein
VSDFQRIITRDESWSFDYPRDSLWAASRDELPYAASRKLTRESAWFRSFGRSTESSVFSLCPKGQRTTYSTSFVTDAVIPRLIEVLRSLSRKKMLKD